LIELGYQDAMKRREEIVAFLNLDTEAKSADWVPGWHRAEHQWAGLRSNSRFVLRKADGNSVGMLMRQPKLMTMVALLAGRLCSMASLSISWLNAGWRYKLQLREPSTGRMMSWI